MSELMRFTDISHELVNQSCRHDAFVCQICAKGKKGAGHLMRGDTLEPQKEGN